MAPWRILGLSSFFLWTILTSDDLRGPFKAATTVKKIYLQIFFMSELFFVKQFRWIYSNYTQRKLRKFGLTKVSGLISPSGANMAWTINLCRFFSFGSYSKGCKLTEKEKKWIIIRGPVNFSYVLYCIHSDVVGWWVRKSPKLCRRNILMVLTQIYVCQILGIISENKRFRNWN